MHPRMSPGPEEPERRPTLDGRDRLFGKGTLVALLVWGLIVLAFSAGGLADVTNLWWLVMLFGLAAPVALLALRSRTLESGAVGGARWAERELLLVLREHGGLTPTAAAMLTPLTAAEAAKTLERLAGEGYLQARAREGAISYSLREDDLRTVSGGQAVTPTEPPPRGAPRWRRAAHRTSRRSLDRAGARSLAAPGCWMHQQRDRQRTVLSRRHDKSPRSGCISQARSSFPRSGDLQSSRLEPTLKSSF